MAQGRGRKGNGSIGPQRVSESDLLGLVGSIYEAGADHSLWPKAIRETVRLMGNTGSHLLLVDEHSGQVSHDIRVNMPERLMNEYVSEMIHRCPRYQNGVAHPERFVLWDYQHIDERDIDHSEYYDWLQDRGEGIRYYLGGRLQPSPAARISYLSLAFHKREGHATREHIRLFRKLLPHFNRALEVGRRVGTKDLALAASLEFVNRLSDAVVLLGASGIVLVANTAAQALARTGGPIRLGTHDIRLQHRELDARLQGLIANAMATACGASTEGGGVIRLSVPPSATLSVVPLTAKDALEPALALARVAVFIHEAGAARTPCAEDVQVALGLTPAEARLACVLAEGVSLAGAAQAAGVSIHTARAQLKQIFAKTDTHRQVDLVRLLGELGQGPNCGGV